MHQISEKEKLQKYNKTDLTEYLSYIISFHTHNFVGTELNNVWSIK